VTLPLISFLSSTTGFLLWNLIFLVIAKSYSCRRQLDSILFQILFQCQRSKFCFPNTGTIHVVSFFILSFDRVAGYRLLIIDHQFPQFKTNPLLGMHCE
jgi:hypothetical protein